MIAFAMPPHWTTGRLSGLRSLFKAVIAAMVFAAGVAPAGALEPSERLDDPVLEQRARAISAELRCVVCQNQSIDDSNAELARDLRRLVRERIKAGDSNSDIKAFLVARYGEFVLLKPPFNVRTILLWMTPVLVLALIGLYIGLRLRSRPSIAEAPVAPKPLSDAERRRVAELISEEQPRTDRNLGEPTAD